MQERSALYIVKPAHAYQDSSAPIERSKETLAELLATESRFFKNPQIGIADHEVIPYPHPIPDRERAINTLFPRYRTIDEPLHELRLFYLLNDRPITDLVSSFTGDLPRLAPEQLYARLGQVMQYITSIPHDSEAVGNVAPFSKLDALMIANRETLGGERKWTEQTIKEFSYEAARNVHEGASLKRICRQAKRTHGFALGRLEVAGHPERIENLTSRLSESGVYLSRIDHGPGRTHERTLN